MTRQLIYLDRAKRDLNNILTHITRETGNLSTARLFVESLREQCLRLARLPGTLGRPRPGLGPGLRSFPVGDYVVYFRYRTERVVIVAVLSRYRDVKGLA